MINNTPEKKVHENEAMKILERNFLSCLEVTTSQHRKYCDCQKQLYENFIEQEQNSEKKVIQRKQITENTIIQHRLEDAKQRGVMKANTYCKENDVRCEVEKEEVISTLSLFTTKYSKYTDDPIFVETVKSVMNHLLTAHRIKKSLELSGLTQSYYDKDGNTKIEINPLLQAQREFDRVKVDALMQLDKKLHGETMTHAHLYLEPMPLEDLYNEKL